MQLFNTVLYLNDYTQNYIKCLFLFTFTAIYDLKLNNGKLLVFSKFYYPLDSQHLGRNKVRHCN